MLSQNKMPSTSPSAVPTAPIKAPSIKNMRMIMPLVAPIVRSTATSRPLSLTSMISPVMMLNAATRMISVKIRNITLRSTSMALKKAELDCRQSKM